MDVRLIIIRDYEKKSNRTFGENKPNQSQLQNRSQKTEYRIQMMERIAKSGFTKDYENERLSSAHSAEAAAKAGPRKNKPNQSQCRIGKQMSENRRQLVRRSPPTQRLVRRVGLGEDGKTDNGRQTTEGEQL